MKPFVAVIGERNSGKSTLIRSLTGCRPRTRGRVEDNRTGHNLYVVEQSPQEAPFERVDLRRALEEIRSDVNNMGAVVALQPNRPHVRMSIEQVFEVVSAIGGFRPVAFVLDPGYENGGSRNLTADVRNRIGQSVGDQLHQLDGRRFALLNAEVVRRTAGLPEPLRFPRE